MSVAAYFRPNIATRCPNFRYLATIPALTPPGRRSSGVTSTFSGNFGSRDGRGRRQHAQAGDAVLAHAGEVGAPAPSTHAPAPTPPPRGTFGRRRPNPEHPPCACPHRGASSARQRRASSRTVRPVSVHGFLRQNVSYFGKRLPRLWPSPTRSGSSSVWSPRRCRPCSTSREDIKVAVDMTASV